MKPYCLISSPADSSGSGWRIWIDDDGGLHFQIGSETNNTDVAVESQVAYLNLWRHVVCSYDSGTARILINGKEVRRESEITQDIASTETLVIGKSGSGSLQVPLMTDCSIISRYTRRVRTQKSCPCWKVWSLTQTTVLASWWKLDETNGHNGNRRQRVNGFDGTLNGTTFDSGWDLR